LSESENAMSSAFLKLEPEKQTRIINAAMKEVTEKKYKDALTDEIAAEAEISKGALFHYFHSKRELLLFLYDYALDVIMEEFYAKIAMTEKDIFKRLRQIFGVKYVLIKKYPDIFNFVKKTVLEEASEVRKDWDFRNKECVADVYDKVRNDIDTAKFKDGVDINNAFDVIIWTIEGIAARHLERTKHLWVDEINYDEVLAEAGSYFDLLRDCFYK